MNNFERELCREIYEAYKVRLHWYAKRSFDWMNSEDLYDIEQETWRILMEKITDVEIMEPEARYNWLLKVCHNQAITLLRKQSKCISQDSEEMEKILESKKIITLEEDVLQKMMVEDMLMSLPKEERVILFRNDFSKEKTKQKRSNADACKIYRIKQKLRLRWKEENADA